MRGRLICDYSAEITDTGQTDSQEPQSMQVSLISYLVSPSEIAETGQTDAQEPHLMQPSVATIFNHSSEGNFFCPSRRWAISCAISGFSGNMSRLRAGNSGHCPYERSDCCPPKR